MDGSDTEVGRKDTDLLGGASELGGMERGTNGGRQRENQRDGRRKDKRKGLREERARTGQESAFRRGGTVKGDASAEP